MMRKNIFICILLLLFSISAWTQESVTVTGIVTDQNKEPLIGVNIAIENMPGLGVITDLNGRYPLAELSQCILDSSNGSIINVI